MEDSSDAAPINMRCTNTFLKIDRKLISKGERVESAPWLLLTRRVICIADQVITLPLIKILDSISGCTVGGETGVCRKARKLNEVQCLSNGKPKKAGNSSVSATLWVDSLLIF